MEDKASDPAAWPEPFRREPSDPPQLIEIGAGHVSRRGPGRLAWRLGPAALFDANENYRERRLTPKTSK